MKRHKPSGSGAPSGPMDAFLKIALKDTQSMYKRQSLILETLNPKPRTLVC